MTDTSQYTGAHKERFDESGKGKGAAGREDQSENTGYVGNYKGEGTHATKKWKNKQYNCGNYSIISNYRLLIL